MTLPSLHKEQPRLFSTGSGDGEGLSVGLGDGVGAGAGSDLLEEARLGVHGRIVSAAAARLLRRIL